MKYEKGTFTVVPNKETLRGLDPHAQVLYMWLCHYAGDNGLCYPSIARLASDCGISRRTTIRRLELLEEKGLISRVHRATDDGDKDTNLYQLLLVGSAGETQPSDHVALPSVSVALPLVPERHHGSASVTHRTQSNELNPLEHKETRAESFEKTISYLDKPPPDDVAAFAAEYSTVEAAVLDTAKGLALWCRSKGRTYKNYRAALQNALRRDQQRKQETKAQKFKSYA